MVTAKSVGSLKPETLRSLDGRVLCHLKVEADTASGHDVIVAERKDSCAGNQFCVKSTVTRTLADSIPPTCPHVLTFSHLTCEPLRSVNWNFCAFLMGK